MPFSAGFGQLFVVSAPSGVGKTTIIQSILSSRPELRFSVSCTTRSPRPGEVDGKDYRFLDREDFLQGIRAGRFLEWAEVHGSYYGTDGEQVKEWTAAGLHVLLDIDVQGARQVRCAFPSAQTIFILPPSMEVLAERLKKRGTESAEQLALRLAAAKREMQESPWYDYIIVNDTLDEAIADFNSVLRASLCKSALQAQKVKSLLFSQPAPRE